jgi:hypothetical protein
MRWIVFMGLTVTAHLSGQSAATPDTASMARAERLMRAACDADRSTTWGTSLCGPFLLANWGSRGVVASQRDSAGAFSPIGRWWVGSLGPGQFPSNSAIDIGGTRYMMVVLPLPTSDAIATTLLMHEQFHRIQRGLNLPMTGPENAHLDEELPRTLLRLEWRALARAVATSGATSCGHIRDALMFRAARHTAVTGSADTESQLERHEGFAEYTGHRLSRGTHPDGDQRLVGYLAEAEGWSSYVRSFAYATGVAYGILLDRTDPTWRNSIATGQSPATMLAERLACPATTATTDQRALQYNGTSLKATERSRADSLQRIRDDYTARLVNGAVLSPPEGAMRFSFDPNTVTPLRGHGNVYPTGSFSGVWGSLEVTAGGALVSTDFQRVRVPLSGRDRDWKLTLAEGWKVEEFDGGQRIVQR